MANANDTDAKPVRLRRKARPSSARRRRNGGLASWRAIRLGGSWPDVVPSVSGYMMRSAAFAAASASRPRSRGRITALSPSTAARRITLATYRRRAGTMLVSASSASRSFFLGGVSGRPYRSVTRTQWTAIWHSRDRGRTFRSPSRQVSGLRLPVEAISRRGGVTQASSPPADAGREQARCLSHPEPRRLVRRGAGPAAPAGPQRFPASCEWSVSCAPSGACVCCLPPLPTAGAVGYRLAPLPGLVSAACRLYPRLAPWATVLRPFRGLCLRRGRDPATVGRASNTVQRRIPPLPPGARCGVW